MPGPTGCPSQGKAAVLVPFSVCIRFDRESDLYKQNQFAVWCGDCVTICDHPAAWFMLRKFILLKIKNVHFDIFWPTQAICFQCYRCHLLPPPPPPLFLSPILLHIPLSLPPCSTFRNVSLTVHLRCAECDKSLPRPRVPDDSALSSPWNAPHQRGVCVCVRACVCVCVCVYVCVLKTMSISFLIPPHHSFHLGILTTRFRFLFRLSYTLANVSFGE